MDYATGLFQGICGGEAWGKHDQAGCMPRQEEGDQVICSIQASVIYYQSIILYNNQVKWGW